ncbi:DUF6884 domain-containing protein [Rhodococcus pyridinivorans]|uniref:DUF6884 domain-containing protein n=1 Tax=Rhodococcus pyridinivorans TaxID=103816 RepID=UPI002078DD76|nr:DUF6884 domain-containing protein [Rhodococcus pyridinivorans]USI91689.1 hypothetical protein LLA01_07345 [Rhodococcus pyridinivorans]
MAQWNVLIERLAAAKSSVRLNWDELVSLVGDLPPSATKHRTWWSGDRPHVKAWRAAGFMLDELRLGEAVTFICAVEDENSWLGVEAPDALRAAERAENTAVADLVLVTCVKSKLEVPAAAKDLYISPLFTRQRAYAEIAGVPWFILSAEYGLVAPDEWLAPYERYLPDTPAAYRAAWGQWVVERLDLLAGPLHGKVVELHAGSAYVNAVSAHLVAKGALVRTPLDGLSMGQRLAWYHSHASGLVVAADILSEPNPDAVRVDTGAFVAALLDHARAMTPAEFLAAESTEWKSPGLYSWWVDAEGAADLAAGLGETIAPGLIYAGLAGATRWPSGKRSTNTLWSRIAGMHLGGRHEFSTFRRSLGSIIAHASDSATIDENELTVWMSRHLKVVAIASTDPDTLGRLEGEVLATIDPPLNLQGMAITPIRTRLKELRRNYR